MKTIDKIKAINLGMSLQKHHGKQGKTAQIYCGDELRAAFLIQALGEIGLRAECETYTVDGEYFVEVKW